MLLLIFSSIEAKAKIDPRMGPIQGVQPNPKAAPTNNGKVKLWLYWSVKILISLFINFKLIIPSNWNEKNIIIRLAIILKIFELVKKNFPINDAVDPKAIKTKEKPKVKKIVAGASLLQLYTGFVYRGPSAAKDIKKELIQILKAEGLNNIKEAIGKGA